MNMDASFDGTMSFHDHRCNHGITSAWQQRDTDACRYLQALAEPISTQQLKQMQR